MSAQGIAPGQGVVCPSCNAHLKAPKNAEPKKPRSTFEKLTWAFAAIVVVAAGYLFASLFFSSQDNASLQNATREAAQESNASITENSSPPTVEPATVNEPQKTVLSDEFKGSMITGFAGYQKGMQWAASYGRVPTSAEYETIKLSFAPPAPASSMDQALYKAFLDGFKAGCKAGLQQGRPAF